MRKSTLIIMAILVVAFGSMMFAANLMIEPYARDAQLATELTRLLESRDELAKDGKVRLLTLKGGGEGRMAADGRGLVISLEPSEEVRTRRGGVRALANFLAVKALDAYTGGRQRLGWVEVTFRTSQGEKGDDLRTLQRLDDEGRLLPGKPQLPVVWPRDGVGG